MLTFRWSWKDGATPAKYAHGLRTMTTRVVREVFAGTQVAAKQVEADLKVTTPRSNEGNQLFDLVDQAFGSSADHVADGWTTRVVAANPTRLAVEVYNGNPRFYEPLKAGSGTTTLGEILEYGSAPHTIEPKNPGGLLVFFWPVVGHVVRFKKVNHPGTRAYGMMAHAAEVGIRTVDATLARASAIVRTYPIKKG